MSPNALFFPKPLFAFSECDRFRSHISADLLRHCANQIDQVVDGGVSHFERRVEPGSAGIRVLILRKLRFVSCVLWGHVCFSKFSCAIRLKVSAATVLSSRGAMTPHWQYEQHQPVKSSFSAQFMRLLIVSVTSLNKIRAA